jgi:excinuclease ABC subunit C
MSMESDADPQIPDEDGSPPSFRVGATVLRAALADMPIGPGVYRMLDDAGEALYVGKARSLKRRVAQYLQWARLPIRLQRMVAETRRLEIVVTHTEVEALLLESNLIKRLMPRFNVLLRDDKSFPHIALLDDHPFPQLAKHRGARERKGAYFGPFASAGAVNQTLTALQRAFLLRSCSDAVFANRTRPCLLFQIKRCSAPCVGRITEAEYARAVADARAFLGGKSREAQAGFVAAMQTASAALDFETAALYRDRIRALTQIQSRQDINLEALGDADVIALHLEGGVASIQVFFFRGGRNCGNRPYFPRHDRGLEAGEILGPFLGQFYDDKPPPPLVLLSHDVPEHALLAEALAGRAGHRVELAVPERGEKRKAIEHALANAREALMRRKVDDARQGELLDGVARVFDLPAPPRRIEVYDNSHIMGREAVGAMIVAGPEGFRKSDYRKFNIRGLRGPDAPDGIAPGDDYGMMREVLGRRFARALKEDPDRESGNWPDLVLVDGGVGQLEAAAAALAELGIDDIALVGVAKGPDRDAGRERFFLRGRAPFQMPPGDPVLFFLQRLRDEAHRFAIGTHRARRSALIQGSALDEIPGIGPKRKRALLLHFGSARAVARAGLPDLEGVAGVDKATARKIYDHFNGGG